MGAPSAYALGAPSAYAKNLTGRDQMHLVPPCGVFGVDKLAKFLLEQMQLLVAGGSIAGLQASWSQEQL